MLDSARADYAAGNARPRVAGRLSLVVVGVGVNDEAAADYAGRSGRHGDGVEFNVDLSATILAGFERRQIASMTLGAYRRACPVHIAA